MGPDDGERYQRMSEYVTDNTSAPAVMNKHASTTKLPPTDVIRAVGSSFWAAAGIRSRTASDPPNTPKLSTIARADLVAPFQAATSSIAMAAIKLTARRTEATRFPWVATVSTAYDLSLRLAPTTIGLPNGTGKPCSFLTHCRRDRPVWRWLRCDRLWAWAVWHTAHAPADYADAVGATAEGVATGVTSAGAVLPFLPFRWFGRPNRVA